MGESAFNFIQRPLQLLNSSLLGLLDPVVYPEGQDNFFHPDPTGGLVHQELCVPERGPREGIHLQVSNVIRRELVDIGVPNDEPLLGHLETPILCFKLCRRVSDGSQ